MTSEGALVDIASRDRTRVPIYCIGLGFSNLGKDEAKARSLLSRIAEFTGGEFTTAKRTVTYSRFFAVGFGI